MEVQAQGQSQQPIWFRSWIVLPSLVLSRLVFVLSCLVLSCFVLSCFVYSGVVLYCLIVFVLSCLVWTCCISSCLALLCLVLWFSCAPLVVALSYLVSSSPLNPFSPSPSSLRSCRVVLLSCGCLVSWLSCLGAVLSCIFLWLSRPVLLSSFVDVFVLDLVVSSVSKIEDESLILICFVFPKYSSSL